MNIEERINKIEEQMDELFEKYWAKDKLFSRTKKYKEMMAEYESLCYQYNEDHNYYYHYDKWINTYYAEAVANAPEKLIGNELTDYVAEQLNKLDGVLLSRHESEQGIWYCIYVITKYTTYSYTIKRGYGRQCGFDIDRRGNYKRRTAKKRVINHICELVYEASLDEYAYMLRIGYSYSNLKDYLTKECGWNILEKKLK